MRGGESRAVKTEGNRQGGVERMLKSARGEKRDGAMLLLGVFDVVAAFSHAPPPAMDCHLDLDVHTTQAARRTHEPLSRKVESTHNGFAFLASTALRQQRPPRLPGRHYPGSTQDHSGSRDPHPRRAMVKQRSPYAGRGVSPLTLS